jgi:hypothetical protein
VKLSFGYCIAASKNRILNRLYRFIARKICLYRQEYRFIAQNLTNFIASSVQENFCLVFSIASSVTKILANKIVSLYSIFFSKIVYLYRFKRYIFEYRCPPLLMYQCNATVCIIEWQHNHSSLYNNIIQCRMVVLNIYLFECNPLCSMHYGNDEHLTTQFPLLFYSILKRRTT